MGRKMHLQRRGNLPSLQLRANRNYQPLVVRAARVIGRFFALCRRFQTIRAPRIKHPEDKNSMAVDSDEKK